MDDLKQKAVAYCHCLVWCLVGGFLPLLIVGGMFKVGFLSFPESQGYAVVNTSQLLKDEAMRLAKESKSEREVDTKIQPFLEKLDQVMTALSDEENLILLQPQAVSSFRALDLTDEVRARLTALSQGASK